MPSMGRVDIVTGRMNVRLLDTDGHKWSFELYIGHKWFASVGGFDSEDLAERQGKVIASLWNGSRDALATLDDLVLNGPTARDFAAAILRKAINGEG